MSKKGTKFSLGEFQKQMGGLEHNPLPTGPSGRSYDDYRDRRGGRSGGGGGYRRDGGDREDVVSSWERGSGGGGGGGGDRGGGGGFRDRDGPRGGGGGFDREDRGGGRGGCDRGDRGYDDRGPRGGGGFRGGDRDDGPPRSRADDGPWKRGGGGGGGDDYDRPPRGGHDRDGGERGPSDHAPSSWRGRGGGDGDLPPPRRGGGDYDSPGGAERPRLNLKPRTAPREESGEGSGQKSAGLFGDAKPVNTAAREEEVLARKMATVGVDDTKPTTEEDGEPSTGEAPAESSAETSSPAQPAEAGEATDEATAASQRRSTPSPTPAGREGGWRARREAREGAGGIGGEGGERPRSGGGRREQREEPAISSRAAGLRDSGFGDRGGDRGDRGGYGRRDDGMEGGGRGGGGSGYGRRDDGGRGGGGFGRRDDGGERGYGGGERGYGRRDEDRGGYGRRDDDRVGNDRRDEGRAGGWSERRSESAGADAGAPRPLRRFAPPANEDLSRQQRGGAYGGDDRYTSTPPPGRVAPTAERTIERTPPEDKAARAKAEEEKKAKKEAEAAKRAAEEEAKRKAKEEAEKQAAEEAERKKAEAAEHAEAAKSLIATGVKGKELIEKARALGNKAKGSALLAAVLAAQASVEDVTSLKWLTSSQYGPVLKALLANDASDQKEAVFAAQLAVESHGYPKVGGDPLIEKVFHGLYGADILDESAFTAWRDDDREKGNKRKAVVQSTPWFLWLETAEEDDEEEEEEDMGIEELNNV